MGWQDDIDSVVPDQRGAKLQEGSYVVHIHEAFDKEDKRKQYAIILGEVLQSSHPAYPVGTEMSQVIRIDADFPDYVTRAKGEVKAFCAAVCGIESRDTARVMAEVKQEVVASIFSKEGGRNAARGSILSLRVFPRAKSAKAQAADAALVAAGQGHTVKPPFMSHEWHPIVENGKPAFRALPPLQKLTAPMASAPQVTAPATAPAFGNGWQAPAGVPTIPGVPAVPSAAWPPAGWKVHPNDPAWFYAPGTDKVLKEADLRILVSQGKA